MATGTLASSGQARDGRLWAIAFGLSLLANVVIVGLVGFAAIQTRTTRLTQPVPAPAPVETVMTILPELPSPTASATAAPVKAAPPPEPAKAEPQFTRTSEDQRAQAPEKAAFIGERDTQATSDRAPDPTAPPLPSQAGIQPRHEEELETTQSKYRDGRMAEESAQTKPAPAAPEPPPAPSPAITEPSPEVASEKPMGEKILNPGTDETNSTPPPPEKLLDGPNPVEVPIPKETAAQGEIKPTPPTRQKDGGAPPKAAELPKPPAPKPINDPAFSGNQRKTAIVGSISRNGRSALSVADTPLGRYQAIIGRAVELEWQRNCVRHRDFITPGYLTVRFFVEPSGKVRTVQFVGQMETGEIQKGFTLNSIRDAEIPPMPASLKQEYAKQPLELVFNFLF